MTVMQVILLEILFSIRNFCESFCQALNSTRTHWVGYDVASAVNTQKTQAYVYG